MQLPTKSRGFHQRIVLIVSEVINVLLYALLIVGLAGIAVGIYQAAAHLVETFQNQDSKEVLETLIIDIIIVLAVVEVLRGILSYLDQGRIRVSLIIEVVLIVTLNEIIRGWFEDGEDPQNSIYLIIVAAILLGLRILAIRYGPETPWDKRKK
jgi:uncharacterized membrane protein (DUF373 family)